MTQVGRYQILDELGRGATSVVYKALDPAIGRTIAIKSIRLSETSDTTEKLAIRERLLREAQSAGILSHPNIITIYDVLESEDFAYILMEYVDGASLEQLRERNELPGGEELLQLLRQIADALDYAHHTGIVHRDIKPANIVIPKQQSGSERLAKIADFGVAKFVSREMTQNGSVTGTPNYMSPEQIQGLAVSGAADQFALGTMVYELLSGEKPFAAPTLASLFYMICKQSPRPVQEVDPALSKTVGKVVSRAMAKEPEERFSSCGDFIGALSIALSEIPGWAQALRAAPLVEAPINVIAAHAAAQELPVAAVPVAAAIVAAATSSTDDAASARVEAKWPETPVLSGWERTAQRESAASGGNRIRLIVALCAAVALAALLIVRWNSGTSTPVQTLDTKTGPTSPPPQDLRKEPEKDAEQAAKQIRPPPTDLSAPPTVAPVADAQPPPEVTRALAAPKTGPKAVPPAQIRPAASRAIREEEPVASLAALSDVELVSDPPGAKITVDSNRDESCSAPCSLQLGGGRHTLAAELNGYSVARRIFQAPAESDVFIPMTRSTGVLVVTSQPSGSSVVVDGEIRGQTPVTLNLAAGRHHLTLLQGGRRHTETIEIDPDGVHARSFRW